MREKEFRLILTQDCNFNCQFCHREGVEDCKFPQLNNDDYEFVLQTGQQQLGWDNVTLSGGEPMLYPHLDDLIQRAGNLGIRQTIITNGSRKISDESLRTIDGFAISLHTTNQEKYKWLTGVNFPIEAIKRRIIDAKLVNPNLNIRINTAVSNGFNSDDKSVYDLIEFSRQTGCRLKLIELCMKDNAPEYFQVSRLQPLIESLDYSLTDTNNMGSIHYSNGENDVTLSKTVCHQAKELGEYTPVCEQENSVMMSCDGTIKPCMHSPFEVNALASIKKRDTKLFCELLARSISQLSTLCPYGKTENISI